MHKWQKMLPCLCAGPHTSVGIEGFAAQVLMADKGYDSDAWIEAVTAEGRQAVMPPCSNRLQQREHNRHLDQERHLSECFINKFKHGRRVFSCFAKLGKNYVGFLSFVCAIIWLCYMSTEPSH